MQQDEPLTSSALPLAYSLADSNSTSEDSTKPKKELNQGRSSSKDWLPRLQMLDSDSQIELWRESATSEHAHEGERLATRLYQACLDSSTCLLQHLRAPIMSKREMNILRRSQALLKLWGDDHGVQEGRLDQILDSSKSVQQMTLSVLNHLFRALLNGVKRYVTPFEGNAASVLELTYRTAEIYSQTKWLLESLESTSDSDSDDSSDSDSGSGSDAVGRGLKWNTGTKFVEDVKVYTECLIDLSAALDWPATDPTHEDEPSVPKIEQRTAHDYHSELIRAKYPQASSDLVECLGKTSWNRYHRLQKLRESIVDTEMHHEIQTQSAAKSQIANSEFKDSGLGTSIPAAPSISYAETVISFMSSVARGSRVRIPPLSAEAKKGVKFECNACGKFIRATNNRDWRKHLFFDIQPYTCLYANCSFCANPFANRQLWCSHLELDHKFGPNWDAVECPLCFQSTEPGKSSILIHFARHMEDIALAALPCEVESDAESEDEDDTQSRSDHLEAEGGAIPSDVDPQTVIRPVLNETLLAQLWSQVDEASTTTEPKKQEYSPTYSPVPGTSTSNALAQLVPPPPDARPGSIWAPWGKLTDYEMATLRKQMKKNEAWNPSLTMIHRELERKHRTMADYDRELARCEKAGEDILNEEPKTSQPFTTTKDLLIQQEEQLSEGPTALSDTMDSYACHLCFTQEFDHINFLAHLRKYHDINKLETSLDLSKATGLFEGHPKRLDLINFLAERISFKCICGVPVKKGISVTCTNCQSFQHAACYYSQEESIPKNHKCKECLDGMIKRARLTRRERPCDACRRRKSRCVIHEGALLCVLCEFHKQECTFVQSPLPHERNIVDNEKKDSPKVEMVKAITENAEDQRQFGNRSLQSIMDLTPEAQPPEPTLFPIEPKIIDLETSPKVFQCPTCSRSFFGRGHFDRHLKTHKKPYPCHECEKAFALRSNLQRHVNATHRTRELQFTCKNEDCGFKCSRLENLEAHVLSSHAKVGDGALSALTEANASNQMEGSHLEQLGFVTLDPTVSPKWTEEEPGPSSPEDSYPDFQKWAFKEELLDPSASPTSQRKKSKDISIHELQKRVSKACDACKRRKVKCNGQERCQQCAHLGLRCVYSPFNKQRSQGRRDHVISEFRNQTASKEGLISEMSESDSSESSEEEKVPARPRHLKVKLSLQKPAFEKRSWDPSAPPSPPQKTLKDIPIDKPSLSGPRRKPPVKSEKRSQSMTLWWAERKARRQREQDEKNGTPVLPSISRPSSTSGDELIPTISIDAPSTDELIPEQSTNDEPSKKVTTLQEFRYEPEDLHLSIAKKMNYIPSDIWVCTNCYSGNLVEIPDECPVCGASR